MKKQNCFLHNSLITLAGTPPITTPDENFSVTTAPDATIELSDTLHPSKKVAFAPTQILFPISIPSDLTPCSRILRVLS